MSQSHNTPGDRSNDPAEALNALGKMLQEGRSFSGHERNCCFLNTGSRPFANISAVSGIDFPDDARAICPLDWDQDGDLDLWISNRNAPRIRMLRNDTPSDSHFLAIRLQGDGKTTSRDAIGARIEVVAKALGEKKMIKTLHAGEGFLSQRSKWFHFGLGEISDIDHVVVHWPGGTSESFPNVSVDGRYLMTQGSGKAQLVEATDRKLVLAAKEQPLAESKSTVRIPIATKLAMPPVRFQSFNHREETYTLKPGRALLLNLWETKCPACLNELTEFSERADELRAAGIDVVALSVDRIAKTKVDPAEGPRLMKRIEFPFTAGWAMKGSVLLMQTFHDFLVPMHRPLPLPTSFLIDKNGRLSVIYKGRVSVDVLLRDVALSDGTRQERRQRAALAEGTLIDHPRLIAIDQDTETRNRFEIAKTMLDFELLEVAARHYQDLIRVNPQLAEAHFNLGLVQSRLGQLGEAIESYTEAERHKKVFVEVYASRGEIFRRMGRFQEALEDYDRAIEINPKSAPYHNARGNIYVGMRRPELAIENFTAAIQLDPSYAQAYYNRGNVHARRSNPEEAIADYSRALERDDKFVPAYNNRGNMYRTLGQYAQALQDFETANELKADYLTGWRSLASLLATCPDDTIRNGARALKLARKGCVQSNWQDPRWLATLASAQAETGNFSEAVRLQTLAINKTPLPQQASLRRQLAMYKSNQPFREQPRK